MNVDRVAECVTTGPSGVGDAVGMGNRHWFVAIVKNNTEKISHERLTSSGYESFIATQTLYRIWKNGKRAKINHVVLPTFVFVKCTEKERMQVVTLPYIRRFMTNKAATSSALSKPLAIIPDTQIETLRFMLGQSDTPVTITDRPYRKGDRVRVSRGKLVGLEGEVFESTEGRKELIVRIDILGCAQVAINPIDVEPIC